MSHDINTLSSTVGSNVVAVTVSAANTFELGICVQLQRSPEMFDRVVTVVTAVGR
jgi:hypothetical protein